MMTNQHNVGIIGTGFGSLVHFPGYQHHPDFHPHTIAGRNQEKTKRVAERLGIENWTCSISELCTNEDIDVISISTPPASHYELVKAALEGGKHVLCEKPLAMNIKQAVELQKLAENTGLTAMLNMEFRYLPEMVLLIEQIQSGVIGEIFEFSISVRNATRINPRTRGFNWWSDKNEGGGVLNALGTIYLDLLLRIFPQVKKIYGRAMTQIPKRLNKMTGKMRKATADDSFVAMFDIDHNTAGTLVVSSVSPFGRGTRAEFFGSNGYLSILEDRQVRVGKLGSDDFPKVIPVPDRLKLQSFSDAHPLTAPFVRLLDEFSLGISKGSSPSPNFTDGVKLQVLVDSIRNSSMKGSAVNIKFP